MTTMTTRSVLALGLVFLAACSSTPVSGGEALAGDVGCHSCHSDTDSSLAPTLNNIYGTVVEFEDGTSTVVDDDYVRLSIIDPQAQIVAGYESARMPTFTLSPEEVDELVEYVRSLS